MRGEAVGIPTPSSTLYIKELKPFTRGMILSVIDAVLNSGLDGDMTYDYKRDEIVFYRKVLETDRERNPMLTGVDEVWIVLGARSDPTYC
jgi:hypothetical protein